MKAGAYSRHLMKGGILTALAGITLGVTLALLTVGTQKRVNAFAIGDVSISLSEEVWDEAGDGSRTVSPGRTVPKDPQITNEGDTEIYAFLEVQVPVALTRVVDDNEKIIPAAVTELFTWECSEPGSGNSPAGWYEVERVSGTDYNTYVYGYTRTLAAGETTVTLFDYVTFADIVEGDVADGTGLTMPVTAHAIQAEYLEDGGGTIEARLLAAWQLYQDEQ